MGLFEYMNITRALSDANRVRILIALDGKELCVCQIIDMLGLSPSTVSKHLSILRNARLITGRKEGRWMYYRHTDFSGSEAAADAIDWTLRCLGDDAQISRDRRHLEEIMSMAGNDRCRQ